MHETFRAFTENLDPKFEALMAQAPVTDTILRPDFKGSGIYMFSGGGNSLYVGRTRDVLKRYGQHTRRSSGHNSVLNALSAGQRGLHEVSEPRPAALPRTRKGLSQ
ncbi:hypothetical protein FHT76_007440 [Rhizobium sp. BK176]|nr:hypothetical protein [Rhizobium sp. BK181]MBB3545050.1 hypothetical protein [Rhizobium sp. BK399]MCS3743732.1 hypothetical protein [Rhizobium sp. BK661]MCS4095721.1 hypothetical protein [Rhizobium sp. BK176]